MSSALRSASVAGSAPAEAPVHDVLVIGAGPFGLGLAALADGIADAPRGGAGASSGGAAPLDLRVLDASPGFRWHGGMLIEGATLQVPFLADLVTLADPTNRWSFLNWLKQTGRLYPFYIREDFAPLRAEYDAYCRWVAEGLRTPSGEPTVEFGREVVRVAFDEAADAFAVTSVASRRGADGCPVDQGTDSATAAAPRTAAADATERTDLTRHLVLATGTRPRVPAPARALVGEDAAGSAAHLHSSQYMHRREHLAGAEHVTVIGSGQSAAEIFLDQLERLDLRRQHLSWLTRSPRFFPMEYTKLTLEMTSPEYTRYFHGLPQSERDRLGRQNLPLYKGISGDLVNAIHEALYRRRVEHGADLPVTMRTACALESSELVGDTAHLAWRHTETGTPFTTTSDATVLATGYEHWVPDFLEPVRDRISWLPDGRYDVALDFTVDAARRIRVLNGEEHTHGLSAPDLGMGPWRAAQVLNDLTGRELFAVEQQIAFQQFGAPDASTQPAGSGLVAGTQAASTDVTPTDAASVEAGDRA